MAQPLYPDPVPTVELHDDHVVLVELTEDDPEVVHALHQDPDPVEAVHQFLRVGARAARTAGTTLDLALVQRSFDTLNRDFGAEVGTAIKRISEHTDGLLDPDSGALAQTLTTLRTELARELDELTKDLDQRFDADSKASVIGKLDALLERTRAEQQQMLRRMLDPSVDGPLAQLRDTLGRTIKDHVEDVRRDLKEITTKLAVDDKEAELIELTTAKGFKFEDLVDRSLGRLAAPHGDVHEPVGHVTGELGTKRGDEIVTLNPDDTGGQTRRAVIEAKDRKLSMRNILEELDEAMANRGAEVAIAVFSAQELAPTHVPFHVVGNRAIVVLDKRSGDDAALKLAYLWARWMLRRVEGDEAEVDTARIQQMVDEARRALTRMGTIKGAHSTIRKKVDEAAKQLECMHDEVEEALTELAELI
jgi:hypothetical protein